MELLHHVLRSIDVAHDEHGVAHAEVGALLGLHHDGHGSGAVAEALEHGDTGDDLHFAFDGLEARGNVDAGFLVNDVIGSDELILVGHIAILADDGTAVALEVQRDGIVGVVPLHLVDDEAGVDELLQIEDVVPMQVGEQDDVHILGLVTGLGQAGLNVVHAGALHGGAVVILVGVLIPGHTGVHQNQLVAALDQEGEIGELIQLVGQAVLLDVLAAGEMIPVLQRLGGNVAAIERTNSVAHNKLPFLINDLFMLKLLWEWFSAKALISLPEQPAQPQLRRNRCLSSGGASAYPA